MRSVQVIMVAAAGAALVTACRPGDPPAPPRDLLVIVDVGAHGKVRMSPFPLGSGEPRPVEAHGVDFWRKHFKR